MRRSIACCVAGFAALAPAAVFAQDLAQDAIDTGDTAWLLTASALLLLLALPGLALFYGGRVRAKNALSVAVQAGGIAAAASLLWIVAGYRLAFGEVTNGFLGGGGFWMLNGTKDLLHGDVFVSERTFALFQVAVAAFAPALMVGAWAGRARFGWAVAFGALWSLLVYAPVAHWVWGGGWLAARFGTLDYAGGIVVQTTVGVSALVTAVLLGKRRGFPETQPPPHSRALSLAGAGLLWAGWFGLTGGWALGASDDAASAILNTHAAASAAALAWLAIEKFTTGKSTGLGFATGAITGLATVTPAAGFISPGAAILFGLAAAAVCYPMVRIVTNRLRIDDALGVFAINGVGGITGSLLLAVFLAPSLGGADYAEGMDMARQLIAQAAGVGAVALWSAIASAILAVGVSLILPMRVGEDAERDGLDVASHGERAWELD